MHEFTIIAHAQLLAKECRGNTVTNAHTHRLEEFHQDH